MACSNGFPPPELVLCLRLKKVVHIGNVSYIERTVDEAFIFAHSRGDRRQHPVEMIG